MNNVLETFYVIKDSNDNFIVYDDANIRFVACDTFKESMTCLSKQIGVNGIRVLLEEYEKGTWDFVNIKLPLKVVDMTVLKNEYDIESLMKEIMSFHKENLVDKCLINKDFDTLKMLF